jgi:hypothetical protein
MFLRRVVPTFWPLYLPFQPWPTDCGDLLRL